MRLGPGRSGRDRSQDIVGTAGVRVGGDDFDAEIAWGKVVRKLGYGLTYDSTGRGKILPVPPHHYRTFCRWENHFLLNTPTTLLELEKYHRWTHEAEELGNFLTVIRNNLGYPLFRSIEQAKIALSDAPRASIRFDQGGVRIADEVEAAEFEQMIAKHLERVHETVGGLLRTAEVSPSEIDSVFLTGGSSLVVPVRETMAGIFGPAKIKDDDAFTSVARGMALTGLDGDGCTI